MAEVDIGGAQEWARDAVGGLLEAAPDAMLVVDEHGTVLLANGQALTMFGYRRAELIGFPVERLIPEASRSAHAAHRRAYAAHPRVREMGSGLDLRARRRDGSEFSVEISLAPLESPDGLLVSAAVRDVTERRRLQAEADRAKDEFFATVSHELRTPLTSILGYAELMEDVEDLPARAQTFLEVINRSARRELRLVDDLLTIVVMESDGLPIRRDDVDLGEVAAEAVAAIGPAAADRGITLEVAPFGVGIRVRGDGARLAQVVDNLLSNAVKFTQAGGTVRVGLVSGGGHATLSVADDGPGIAPAEQLRLFERLYRTRAAVEGNVPGAGLGLPIARGIVEAHRGRLEVDSAPGVGSTFRVLLPLLSSVGGRTPASATPTHATG